MTPLILQLECEGGPVSCPLCGHRVALAPGPSVRTADSLEPVCRSCSQEHAPALTALADLARAAEQVGRIGRHTVSPPLTALLQLARAAEAYAGALPPSQRLQAG